MYNFKQAIQIPKSIFKLVEILSGTATNIMLNLNIL